ncbi:hypothetical protein [Falsiroseomonas sp. HW251]|uniref:hypothetical protein n=1 Tax=Falsiroseomonas sp. HW251 TaxID=3390998 RepID=UPI003D3164C3
MPLAGKMAALIATGALSRLTPSMAKIAMEHGMRPLRVATIAAASAAVLLAAAA